LLHAPTPPKAADRLVRILAENLRFRTSRA
jgi:hypothetical protein